MQTFRAIVIGTLNLVAVLFFLASLVIGGAAGYLHGGEIAGGLGLSVDLPAPVYAAAGVVIGWVAASVVLGLLFVLIDIQDGIRDLHRDLTRKPE